MSRKLPPVIRTTALTVSKSLVSSRVERQAELVPVVGQDEREVVGVERLVLVGEADPAVQLGVAGQLPVEAGHADQDQAEVAAVEEVAELFQAGGL